MPIHRFAEITSPSRQCQRSSSILLYWSSSLRGLSCSIGDGSGRRIRILFDVTRLVVACAVAYVKLVNTALPNQNRLHETSTTQAKRNTSCGHCRQMWDMENVTKLERNLRNFCVTKNLRAEHFQYILHDYEYLESWNICLDHFLLSPSNILQLYIAIVEKNTSIEVKSHSTTANAPKKAVDVESTSRHCLSEAASRGVQNLR